MSNISFRDWQHASRLFRTDNYKFGPKLKFLYHVSFYLTNAAKHITPMLELDIDVVGMLVKSVDMPRYSVEMATLNKYNRKKHVQSKIEYHPVSMSLHDDNHGLTRHLLEGYYKYYFADGSHEWDSGAFGNSRNGDTTYKNSMDNRYSFGLDNNRTHEPFFEKIEISQMSRGQYYMYTLVRPIITEWSHDNLNYSEGGMSTENKITIAYDAVNYSTGNVNTDSPTGFGNDAHYDNWEE